MIETIEAEGKVLAMVLRSGHESQGVQFFSHPEYPLQLGLLQHPKGTRLKPHIHTSITKTINNIQEVLHLEYGQIEVEFFRASGQRVASCLLNGGDTILLVSGGHGFRILEETKMLEIKQGPYESREKDKEYLRVESNG